VLRQPSFRMLHSLARSCDVVLQNLISLRTLVAILPSRRPVVVTHQSWMRRTDGTRGPENYAKLLAVRACHNVSISKPIADSLPVPSTIIGNPFEVKEFSCPGGRTRDKDIVFLGRLVSDKGCDVLLEALTELGRRGLFPGVTVIGDGPEMPALKRLAAERGIEAQVEFLGSVTSGRGEVVARHRIMAIPSRWEEPFGVVALEGIASGCAIVASARGGLPDAAGSCGLYFPNGDAIALATELQKLLVDPELEASLVANGPEHLRRFQPEVVAAEYINLFRKLL
jgi:glycogen(starch) synthase